MSQQKHRFGRIMPVVRGLMIGIGMLVIGTAGVLELLNIGNDGIGSVEVALIGIGSAYIAAALLMSRLGDRGIGLSAAMLMGGALLTGLEVCGHVLDYDFNRTFEAWNSTPIYYRQPIEPVGDAFFRRQGPESWTGKVLHTQLKRVNAAEHGVYADEEIRTYEYDHLGFRNSTDLKDWDIVFVGDSFTELGYLPHEELVSSRVGEQLGVSVKNLGASYTGTLTHNFYLQKFGKSSSTRKAVLVFFEGNDIKDAVAEHTRLEAFRADGTREYRDLQSQRQTSFLVASIQGLRSLVTPKPSPITNENAIFESADGDVPVTLLYALPNADELEPIAKQAIRGGIADWAKTANELGLEPWLVYMPVKHRVIHQNIRYTDNTEDAIRNWQPSDLPQHIAGLCEQNGISFIDATPALVATSASGQLPYNAIWDTHLNSLGTQVVADLIAKRLTGDVETVQSEPAETGETKPINPDDLDRG